MTVAPCGHRERSEHSAAHKRQFLCRDAEGLLDLTARHGGGMDGWTAEGLPGAQPRDMVSLLMPDQNRVERPDTRQVGSP